jgi:FkbM family methyltransferase
MLLDFDNLIEKYDLKINGIIQAGINTGQELSIYNKHNIKNLIGFEPVPNTFKILQENIKQYPDMNIIIVNKAVGNMNGVISMNIENVNECQSSSILKPKLHLTQYPHIKFTDKIEVDIIKLDDYNDIDLSNYNFYSLDLQGFELEALKGSVKTLEHIDYIMCEVNRAELYEGCPMVEDIIEFLKPFGFVQKEISWDGSTWGDIFMAKEK